jgi:hypothetical protein
MMPLHTLFSMVLITPAEWEHNEMWLLIPCSVCLLMQLFPAVNWLSVSISGAGSPYFMLLQLKAHSKALVMIFSVEGCVDSFAVEGSSDRFGESGVE